MIFIIMKDSIKQSLREALNNQEYITIVSDASFSPATGFGGYGFWIKSDNLNVERWGKFKDQLLCGANEAEILSILNAMHWLVQNKQTNKHLRIRTDSTTAVGFINNGNNLSRKYPELNEKYRKFFDDLKGNFPSIIAKWVKGHSRKKDNVSHLNRRMDTLSRKYQKQPDNG